MKHPLAPVLIAVASLAVSTGPLANVATADPVPSPRPAAPADRDAISALDSGNPGQNHGDREGHLPARRENVRLVGKAAVDDRAPGRVADVEIYRKYAYLAAYSDPDCSNGGVYVMDANNLRAPKQVGFIPTGEGSFVSEGMQVMTFGSGSARRDVLLFNNEVCADEPSPGTVGGATLVDVSNPLQPEVLASGFGDLDPESAVPGTAHQAHSGRMWQSKGKVYAVLVDDEEAADVDIFDITDPREPTMIAEYDLAAEFPQILQDGLDEVFLHDVTIHENKGRMIMLASYWDAGQVKFDVTDPANIRYLGDTDYAEVDPQLLEQAGRTETPEGNAHQAEFTRYSDLIIGTDEDFSPYRAGPFSITTGPAAGEYPSTSVGGGGSAADTPDKILNGPVVNGGYGCPTSSAIPPADEALAGVTLAAGEERIVVLQRGPVDDPGAPEEACFPGEKAAAAIAAGYDAVVLVNRHLGSAEADAAAEPFCGSGAFPAGDPIPTVCTTHEAFHNMFGSPPAFDLPYLPGTEPALGAIGERISVTARFDGWGYVHLYGNNAGKIRELDTYAIPEAMDARYAEGFGALSVHEVATSEADDRLGYLSYYAGGFRVVKVSGGKLREVGVFIDEDGNDFWGVEVFKRNGVEYVAASDRDYGLYILRYTGKDRRDRKGKG